MGSLKHTRSWRMPKALDVRTMEMRIVSTCFNLYADKKQVEECYEMVVGDSVKLLAVM